MCGCGVAKNRYFNKCGSKNRTDRYLFLHDNFFAVPAMEFGLVHGFRLDLLLSFFDLFHIDTHGLEYGVHGVLAFIRVDVYTHCV